MANVPSQFQEIMSALTARRDLSAEQMQGIMEDLMTGRLGEAEAAGFLVALRLKGETAPEIAAAARVLRRHMLRWDPGLSGVLDTCGTGGDNSGTFNISTAAAFVVAAAGVPVVKHGNRSVSSRSGSADVLAALGVSIEGDADFARRCLEAVGLAFCFAPCFHPAMKQVAGLRRRLGVSTIFNLLGPLVNPAGVSYQLLGVGRRDWLDPLAGALAELGTGHALVVCSEDGLDEVGLSAPTLVREVRGQRLARALWQAEDFGLEACGLEELQAAGVQESAARISEVLAGKKGPAQRIVLANAAAALWAADRVPSLSRGVEMAAEAISSGRAGEVLCRLRELRP